MEGSHNPNIAISPIQRNSKVLTASGPTKDNANLGCPRVNRPLSVLGVATAVSPSLFSVTLHPFPPCFLVHVLLGDTDIGGCFLALCFPDSPQFSHGRLCPTYIWTYNFARWTPPPTPSLPGLPYLSSPLLTLAFAQPPRHAASCLCRRRPPHFPSVPLCSSLDIWTDWSHFLSQSPLRSRALCPCRLSISEGDCR